MNETFALAKVEIDGLEINTINARDLHVFLEVGKDFSTWIKKRIEQYDFIEDRDFVLTFPQTGERRNVRLTEYHLSLGMAKELSMVEKNEKGKQARRYFIECERIAISRVIPAYVPTHQIQNKQVKNPIIPVEFNNDTIYLIEHDGAPYALIHPILENIGINWTEEFANKYSATPRNTRHCVSLQPEGSQDKILCIPLKKLDEFLAKTKAWKFRKYNQDAALWKLIKYKHECVNELYRAWFKATQENDL